MIIAFLCWCSYSGADEAGVQKVEYSPDVRVIRIPCSALLNPSIVLKAFEKGADGVIISACKPSEFRYIAPSRQTELRVKILRSLLKTVGISEERIKLVWISAPEGEKFAEEVDKAVSQIEALGPLKAYPAVAEIE